MNMFIPILFALTINLGDRIIDLIGAQMNKTMVLIVILELVMLR